MERKLQDKKKEYLLRGFTLVELLVVIIIIVIISTIVFLNYRSGRQRLALERAAHRFLQDVRRAQEMAMSAREVNGIIPLGGYGVYTTISDLEHYIIFADCNDNDIYDPPPATPCNGKTERIERITLEQGVTVCPICDPEVCVIFTPPDPEVTIFPPRVYGEFTLVNEIGESRGVYVNRLGVTMIVDLP